MKFKASKAVSIQLIKNAILEEIDLMDKRDKSGLHDSYYKAYIDGRLSGLKSALTFLNEESYVEMLNKRLKESGETPDKN